MLQCQNVLARRHTFLLFVFLASVDMVLELDAHLALCGLISDEGMFEQLLRVGPLVVILDKHSFNEAVELFGPLFRLEPRRRIARNEEESAHWMHVAQGRLRFGHLECRDSQTPQIAAVVVCRF